MNQHGKHFRIPYWSHSSAWHSHLIHAAMHCMTPFFVLGGSTASSSKQLPNKGVTQWFSSRNPAYTPHAVVKCIGNGKVSWLLCGECLLCDTCLVCSESVYEGHKSTAWKRTGSWAVAMITVCRPRFSSRLSQKLFSTFSNWWHNALAADLCI